MGWQDRPYYRDDSRTAGNPLMWLLTGSIPLFTAFGIRVRAHASMLLLIGLTLLFAGSRGGMGFQNAITFSTTLFGVILLHEFGHCFAARSVGGSASDILMWPLGGLAFADAPQRPWPQLWTTLGGPLVNVGICVLTGVGMAVINRSNPGIPWNPLSNSFSVPHDSTVGYYLWFVFVISWGNLLFNLLPIYPLDGGRLLQEMLWFPLGFYRASLVAANVGIVGSVLMGAWGVIFFFSWYGQVLLFLGISCLLTCMSLRAQLRAAGPYAFEQEVDYSAAYDIHAGRPGKTRRTAFAVRRAAKRAQKLARQERAEQEKIDRILAKVSAHGMNSLSWFEKRTLRKATEHQKQRDRELEELRNS